MNNKNQRLNKKEMIRRHLLEHGSITSMQAINLYGSTRLSAVIFKLKREGMDIETERAKTIDRYGGLVIYAIYRLRKNEEEAV